MSDGARWAKKRYAGQRLLAVDDEPLALSMYERYMSEFFAEVRTAIDAATATRLLTEALDAGNPFHVLLVDLNLGCDRGEAVIDHAERLRVRPRIVAFSGSVTDLERLAAVRARVIFLSKSALPEELLEQLGPDAYSPLAAFAELHGLTSRQADVIERILANDSDKEIAEQLRVTVATVRDYINGAAGRVGVSGRQGLSSAFARFCAGRLSGIFARVGASPAGSGLEGRRT